MSEKCKIVNSLFLLGLGFTRLQWLGENRDLHTNAASAGPPLTDGRLLVGFR